MQAHSLLFAPQRPVKNSRLPEQVVHSGQSAVAKQSVQVSQVSQQPQPVRELLLQQLLQPQPLRELQFEQLLQPQPERELQLEQLLQPQPEQALRFQLFQPPQQVQRLNTALRRFSDLSAP